LEPEKTFFLTKMMRKSSTKDKNRPPKKTSFREPTKDGKTAKKSEKAN